jgi:hypothetical protein
MPENYDFLPLRDALGPQIASETGSKRRFFRPAPSSQPPKVAEILGFPSRACARLENSYP